MKFRNNPRLISRNKTNDYLRNTMIKMNSEDPFTLTHSIISNFNSPRSYLTNNKISENNNLIHSIEKFAFTTKDFSLDDTSRNLMSNYIYSSPNINNSNTTKFEDFMTETKRNFFQLKKKEVKGIIYKSKRYYKEHYKKKISFDYKYSDFKNPIDSLGLILRNRCIHDNIMKTFCDKTLKSFGKTLNKFNSIQDIKNINEKKIKITSIIPRALIDEKKKTGVYYDFDEEVATTENQFIVPKNCFKNGVLILYCKYISLNTIIPESREQFSMDIDLLTNTILLFGGLISNIKDNSLWKFNLYKMKWEKTQKINNQPELRYGHTGIILKNKFVLYGGKIISKETYNNLLQLDIYDIKLNIWYSPYVEKKPKARRNHIACAIGKHMFIHGGINEEGEYLNDCYILNINNLKWMKLDLFYYKRNDDDEYDKNQKLSLAYHSCSLVISNEIKNNNKFSIFKMIDLQINKKYYRIREQGLYIFGGKNKENYLSNKLIIIKLGKIPLEYKTIEPLGKGPSPRFMSSMNFFEPGNFLIIHGGKNEFNSLNDTYILEVHRMEWLKVDFEDNNINLVKNRCSHQSVIQGNELIIFGGMDDKNYVGSDLFFINIDPTVYDEKIKREQLNINVIFGNENKEDNKNNNKKFFQKYNFNKVKKLIKEQKNNIKLPKV